MAFDAALSIYSDDGKHSFNFIGRNLHDEIVIIGGGAIREEFKDKKALLLYFKTKRRQQL